MHTSDIRLIVVLIVSIIITTILYLDKDIGIPYIPKNNIIHKDVIVNNNNNKISIITYRRGISIMLNNELLNVLDSNKRYKIHYNVTKDYISFIFTPRSDGTKLMNIVDIDSSANGVLIGDDKDKISEITLNGIPKIIRGNNSIILKIDLINKLSVVDINTIASLLHKAINRYIGLNGIKSNVIDYWANLIRGKNLYR